MDHKWKQLIPVVNFLFGLRVNETLNKTFILDSDRPFICDVYLNSCRGSYSCYLNIFFEICVAIMAPVSQLICVKEWRKSTNTL
jgi:hypothetical protein